MHAISDAPDFTKIALKWHDLAERRLDYYTELYRSGRYKHYYTQERFALRMLEVIEAAKVWRALAGLPREKRPEVAAQLAVEKTASAQAVGSKAGGSKTAEAKTAEAKTADVKVGSLKSDNLKSDSRKSEISVRRAAGLRPAA